MTYCSFCMEPIQPTYKVCPHCGKPTSTEIPAHHLLPGTILNGKFLVGAALGEGGFGITYIGRDLTLDIKVAIKEFFPSGYVNRTGNASPNVTCSVSDERKDVFDKGRERFLREARILAKFSSEPGVVEVRDFFEANNTAYIIMEYLDGADLKQMLRSGGAMAPGRVIELMMPVMKTLTKIHAQGLIHRDISPDNIRMCRGTAKLLDFGAARDVSAVANKSLSVMLKPGFAPEEQYRSRGDQGAWTDVYALCATMYVCITGITPDDATQRVFNDEVKAPSALGIVIAPNIEYAIMKGMAIKQEDRFQTVDELIAALTGAAAPAGAVNDGRTVAVNHTAPNMNRPAYQQPQPQPQPQYSAPAYNAPAPKKKGGKGILVVFILLLLAAAIAAGAYFFINYDDGGRDRKKDNETTETGATGGTNEPVTGDEVKIKFSIDGVEYGLPCNFSDFTDNGWTIYRYSDIGINTIMPPNSYSFGFFEKNGEDINVLVYNDSDEAKPAKDCKVGNVNFYFSQFDIVLPEGVSGIPTKDQLIEAYGEPLDMYEGEDYVSLNYVLDENYNTYMTFMCYNSEEDQKYSGATLNGMNTIELEYVDPESLEEGEPTEEPTEEQTDEPTEEPTEEDTEEPTEEQTEAPTAPATDEPSKPFDGQMSDNLFDFTFTLDGKVYQLPCDYSELAADGWYISYGGTEDTQLDDKTYMYISFKKNDAKFTTYVYNVSGSTKALKDCRIGFLDFHNDAGITLAKGITPLSTREEVIAAFGEPVKEATYDNYTRLEYTINGDVFVKFYCYTERTELFSRIEVKNFIY